MRTIVAVAALAAGIALAYPCAWLGFHLGHISTVAACHRDFHTYPRCDYILAHANDAEWR